MKENKVQKGGLSRRAGEHVEMQTQAAPSDMEEFKRIAAIAGERYREVCLAMERAVDRAREIDKKFTQATIELLKETARWEDLLKQYQEESSQPDTAAPSTEVEPVTKAESVPEELEKPQCVQDESGSQTETPPAAGPAEKTFVLHVDRMQVFRRSHAGLK